MTLSDKKLAGLLLVVGGVQWILAVIVAEARYPDYSIARNYISDLGVERGSALIFNGSTFLLGALVMAAAYAIRREFGSRFFVASLFLAGVGPLGVGIFNENHIVFHSLFALIAFVFGGVSAVAAAKFLRKPISHVAMAIGAFMLLALIFLAARLHFGIGVGGMERMIAYPTLLWTIGFGGYLLGDACSAAVSQKV